MDLISNKKSIPLKELIRILKFGMTGLLGLTIDFSITWFCREYLGWNDYIANTCGFSVAVINNYLINKVWTFKSTEKNLTKEFSKFLLVSAAGLCINTGCLFLIHQKLHLLFYSSKALAVLIVFVWNYTINTTFTFRQNAVG